MSDDDYVIPLQRCPWCEAPVDRAGDFVEIGGEARAPKPTDFSICIRCAFLSVYEIGDGGLRLRRATSEEVGEAIREQPELERVLAAAQLAVAAIAPRH